MGSSEDGLMKLFDHVLAKPNSWPWGLVHQYDRIPGVITHIESGVITVQWHDGHSSLHSEDELVPYSDPEQ